MKKLLLVLLSVFTLKPAAVTYDFSGGRLGDNIIAYSHARWVSYKYDIPLLYRPFNYSDQFGLHFKHRYFEMEDAIEFDKVVKFSELEGKHNELDIDRNSNTLYIVPYFPPVVSDIQERFHFDIGWKEPGFQKLLHEEIVPIDPIIQLDLPQGKHHVAVHVRTGAGWDKIFQMKETTSTTKSVNPVCKDSNEPSPSDIQESEQEKKINNKLKLTSRSKLREASKSKFADRLHPFKFPPNSYYVEQITRMSELLGDEPMYVHIFSDSSEVAAIAQYFEKEVNKPNIEFGYRKEDNKHDANVLDDMYGLLQFDYLIRPESNFSIIAGKLKVYNITIYPAEYSWKLNKLCIDKAVTLIKDRPESASLRSRLSNGIQSLLKYFKE